MSTRRRAFDIPELDGFRVLLVFIVSWYHIWQQSWLTPAVGGTSLDFLVRSGYMHVDGTILLSGFLLFLPYAQAMLDGGPLPSVRGFYQRRAARIVPSYLFFTGVMLFAVALPYGLYYGSTSAMWRDILTHLTFTFTFTPATYVGTQLGTPSWTLCIELQMYLLFPLIARGAVKKPMAVMLGMAAIAAYFRMWALSTLSDYNMVVNQLISFLDVYALGMALSCAYVRLQRWYQALTRRRWAVQTLATALLALCVWLLVLLLRRQAASNGYTGLGSIQANQLLHRLPLTLLYGGCILSLPFALLPLRWLMGNPIMRFLSGISMNYYLVHQPLAVHLRRLNIPYSEYDYPNQVGIRDWQYQYTWLCFGLAFAAAVLMTYLVEKPAAWGLRKLFAHLDARRAAKRTSPV